MTEEMDGVPKRVEREEAADELPLNFGEPYSGIDFTSAATAG